MKSIAWSFMVTASYRYNARANELRAQERRKLEHAAFSFTFLSVGGGHCCLAFPPSWVPEEPLSIFIWIWLGHQTNHLLGVVVQRLMELRGSRDFAQSETSETSRCRAAVWIFWIFPLKMLLVAVSMFPLPWLYSTHLLLLLERLYIFSLCCSHFIIWKEKTNFLIIFFTKELCKCD